MTDMKYSYNVLLERKTTIVRTRSKWKVVKLILSRV
jgi:hypothetical protein